MSKHISLAQHLAQLDLPAPLDIDPEDAGVTNGLEAEDAIELDDSVGREHYLDVGPSSLRDKLQESLSDPKYEGIRISRKQIEEDESDDTDGVRELPVTSDEELENRDEEQNDQETHTETPPERFSEASKEIVPASQKIDDQDLSSTLKCAREEERKKGKAVSRQLVLYDSLIDARIRMQKCVASMNRLPDATNLPIYLSGSGSRDAVNKMLSESLSLADELFDLQEKLMTTNEGLHPPARKRQRIEHDREANRDWEEEVRESSNYFTELEASFHPHLLTTLQKWSNKVLAIAPSALLPSNRTKFSNKNANRVKSAVELVDEALLEREKLVARTQTRRGPGDRLGADVNINTTTAAAAADIFDDTDFYQSLLRDIIDSRSSSTAQGLPEHTASWRLAQQARKSQRKSTIDTRASKGRKLRFEVHEKLQNFMAPTPMPVPSGAAWHEAQIDELFASLLGKGLSEVEVEEPRERIEEDRRLDMNIDVKEALKGGFRVFG